MKSVVQTAVKKAILFCVAMSVMNLTERRTLKKRMSNYIFSCFRIWKSVI